MLGSRVYAACKMMAGEFADTVMIAYAQTSDGEIPHENARTPNRCRISEQIAVGLRWLQCRCIDRGGERENGNPCVVFSGQEG